MRSGTEEPMTDVTRTQTQKRMAAKALLASMQTVLEALLRSPGLPPEQLIAYVREWRRMVVDLLQEPVVELATLCDTIGVLNSSLDLTETLERVMDSLIELTGAERSCLMLLDEDGDLEVRAARHFDHQNVSAFDLKLSYTVVREAIEGGQPVLTTNAQLDPRFSEQESVVSYRLRSIVCVPLCVREGVIGALYLDNRMREGVFSQSDLPLLTVFAGQAAVAIENARLHQALRRHADDLAAAVTQLQELDRVKDELIQNVSHELRTPLSVIHGYITLLDAGDLGELPPKQREAMTIINRQVKKLNCVVDDITLLLEVESSPQEPGPVLLDELVLAAVEDFRIAIQRARLKLKVNVSPDLPPVSGSPVYLRRMLDSLLSNAIKFTPEEGTIGVQMWRGGDRVVLQVSDTGIGIPPEQQKRIFDRFYQVDGSTRRRYGGMGLGLALVKEVVEAHGGTVSVQSKVGEGSVFTVTLPIVGGGG